MRDQLFIQDMCSFDSLRKTSYPATILHLHNSTATTALNLDTCNTVRCKTKDLRFHIVLPVYFFDEGNIAWTRSIMYLVCAGVSSSIARDIFMFYSKLRLNPVPRLWKNAPLSLVVKITWSVSCSFLDESAYRHIQFLDAHYKNLHLHSLPICSQLVVFNTQGIYSKLSLALIRWFQPPSLFPSAVWILSMVWAGVNKSR